MSKREANRQRFPHCSAEIDAFRAEFGDVVVLKVVEGGQRVEARNQLDESRCRVQGSLDFLAIGKLDREMAALRERKTKRGRK